MTPPAVRLERVTDTDSVMSAAAPTLEDCLPLARLYARFDAIAEGLVRGDSGAAHRAILDRLAANRRTAEGQGWTACALERQGGSGRLLLSGVRPKGGARDVVPDWIPGRSAVRRPELLGLIPRSPNEVKEERYRHLEILIRERLLAASPAMTAGAFARLSRRLIAAAYKHAAAPPSAGTSGAGPYDTAPPRPEAEADARWLDDGGA